MTPSERWLDTVGELLEAINSEASAASQAIWVEDTDEVPYIIKRISIDDEGHIVLHLGM